MFLVTPDAFGAECARRGERYTSQLSFLDGASRFGAAVTAREFLNPAGGVDEFLFAREKRVASGTNTDLNIAARRTGMINRPARAANIGL
jgi:hypothetical protein